MEKKSLKNFIWSELDKKGYILDQEVYKFLKKEPNYYTIEVYKREYQSYKKAKEYFDQKINKNSKIHHYRKRYSLSINGENEWYKIPKSYYEELSKTIPCSP